MAKKEKVTAKAASKQKKETPKVQAKVRKPKATADTAKVKTGAKTAIRPAAKSQTSKPDKKLISYIVNGQVSSSDCSPQPGLNVKAFDRNVGVDDKLLGQATTDDQGNYSISYTVRQLGGNNSANLVICLFQDGELLQTSDVILDAGQESTKDFVIPVTPPPEFQRLADTIKPLLRGKIGIGRLTKEHISFLRKRIAVEETKIDRLVQSHALAGDDQTLAAFYYGLLSQDLPTDPAALLGRPRASIQAALDRAAILKQIPRLQPQVVDTILNATLPKLRAENLLEASG